MYKHELNLKAHSSKLNTYLRSPIDTPLNVAYKILARSSVQDGNHNAIISSYVTFSIYALLSNIESWETSTNNTPVSGLEHNRVFFFRLDLEELN